MHAIPGAALHVAGRLARRRIRRDSPQRSGRSGRRARHPGGRARPVRRSALHRAGAAARPRILHPGVHMVTAIRDATRAAAPSRPDRCTPYVRSNMKTYTLVCLLAYSFTYSLVRFFRRETGRTWTDRFFSSTMVCRMSRPLAVCYRSTFRAGMQFSKGFAIFNRLGATRDLLRFFSARYSRGRLKCEEFNTRQSRIFANSDSQKEETTFTDFA